MESQARNVGGIAEPAIGRRDPAVAKLAYETALSRIVRQEAKLDEFRRRATGLLGVAAVMVTFFAGATISDRGSGFSAFTFVGLLATCVAVALGLSVHFPMRAPPAREEGRRAGWIFGPKLGDLVESFYEGNYESRDGRKGRPHTLEETHAALARQMAAWHKRNEAGFRRLHRRFSGAVVALGVGLAAWLTDLLWFYERAEGALR